MSELDDLLDDVDSLLNFVDSPTNSPRKASEKEYEMIDDLLDELGGDYDDSVSMSIEDNIDEGIDALDDLLRDIGNHSGMDDIDDVTNDVTDADSDSTELDKDIDDEFNNMLNELGADDDHDDDDIDDDIDRVEVKDELDKIVQDKRTYDDELNIDINEIEVKENTIKDDDYIEYSSDSLDIESHFDLDAPVNINIEDLDNQLVSVGKTSYFETETNHVQEEEKIEGVGVYDSSELDRVINSIRERVKDIIVTFGDCEYCGIPILTQSCNAFDKSWHVEHFFCGNCGDIITEDQFAEEDGEPWCINCFSKQTYI